MMWQLAKHGIRKDQERANDTEASRAALWSWLDPNTWQMRNSSTLNVLQLQPNEMRPREESRPPWLCFCQAIWIMIWRKGCRHHSCIPHCQNGDSTDIWHTFFCLQSFSVQPQQTIDIINWLGRSITSRSKLWSSSDKQFIPIAFSVHYASQVVAD